MDKRIEKKISALDPRFRKKISDLFESINESVSMLYEAATHDEKTGLYNHNFFETILDMEIEKAKRGQQELSLIMIDIDFFKKINDSLGHIKADELLKHLANIIQKNIRKSDIAARFGGEEFTILLPETNIEKAKIFSSKLKSLIHQDRTLKKYSITVSGGISQFKNKDSKKSFKERADKALYQAKHNGRDQFVAME